MQITELFVNAEFLDAQGPLALAFQALLPFIYDLMGRGAIAPDAGLAPADEPRMTSEWLADGGGSTGGGGGVSCTSNCSPPPPPPGD